MILQFKGIEYKFLIGNGEIYNLKIENQHFLADILSWLQEMDEEKIMLFEIIFLDLQKYLLFLSDVINLDLNIKKQLTTLYTNIDKNIINDEQRRIIIDFGCGLGTNDIDGQTAHCRYYQELIKPQVKSAFEDKRVKSRLYVILGTCLGIAVALLLL